MGTWFTTVNNHVEGESPVGTSKIGPGGRLACGGFTLFELVIVLSLMSALASVFYWNAVRPGLEGAKFRQISRVMENVADAVEEYVESNGAAPPNLAATGYTPPAHPFGQAYQFQVALAERWVRVSTLIPANRARAQGPGSFVSSFNANWDLVEIRRPFSTNGIWFDKKWLYNE
jgi:prepilin-type N-terminal cleavage/methylation domain-containing protein